MHVAEVEDVSKAAIIGRRYLHHVCISLDARNLNAQALIRLNHSKHFAIAAASFAIGSLNKTSVTCYPATM